MKIWGVVHTSISQSDSRGDPLLKPHLPCLPHSATLIQVSSLSGDFHVVFYFHDWLVTAIPFTGNKELRPYLVSLWSVSLRLEPSCRCSEPPGGEPAFSVIGPVTDPLDTHFSFSFFFISSISKGGPLKQPIKKAGVLQIILLTKIQEK